MARPSGLGRGLSSLIPEAAEQPGTPAVLRNVAIGDITPNPNQPRVHFDQEALDELADSVAELGVLQPILVRELGDGRYELVAGERRWRAATQAGLETIPVLVRDIGPEGSLAEALVENLHRRELNVLEEASAYQQLMDQFGLTQTEVAKRVGKSRPVISTMLGTLTMPQPIQKLVAEDRLTATQARMLQGVPQKELAISLAEEAADGGMTVRDLRERVREAEDDYAALTGAPKRHRSPKTKTHRKPKRTERLSTDPALLELEERLEERFSTSVSVAMGSKRGRIVIDFSTVEDLERIYRLMMLGSSDPEYYDPDARVIDLDRFPEPEAEAPAGSDPTPESEAQAKPNSTKAEEPIEPVRIIPTKMKPQQD